jgi:pimeloyl-ACP methyl ester carboxylesterase
MVVRARGVQANGLEFGLLEVGSGPFAPTAVPDDGRYGIGALVADAVALHQALDGDGDAVLIGHDWGAEAAYGTAAFAPERWRRVATLGVPPPGLDPVLFGDYQQLKRFFYLFLAAAISYYRDPAVVAPPGRRAGRPTLYLHGSADGCIGAGLVGGAERLLPSGSRMTLVQGAGHLLHLEKPEEVNRHILSWVTG